MRIFKRIAKAILFGVPALLLRVFNIRILSVTHPDRIGHLCIEPDCYIKEGALGLRAAFHGIFLIPRKRVANDALLRVWSKRLPVVTSDICCRLLKPLTGMRGVSYSMADYAVAIDRTARCASIFAQWAPRPPVISYPQDQIASGWSALRALGLPANAWFVCIHSREGGYSPHDEHLHSFRNSDIDNYRLAMQEIVSAGGWCVRVGEASSKPSSPMKGVIDYAHSAIKSDRMDMFLCANCLFFLGNSSGLYLLSALFGVRSALANLIPVSSSLPVVAGDIGIPKLLRWRSSGQLLQYSEILSSSIANFRFAKQYQDAGIIVEENSPEDIRDLAREMLHRLQGKGEPEYTEEDEALQARFHTLFQDGHYSFGAASRVGRDFLRHYSITVG